MANLGSVWQVQRIGHKPFPCGGLTHGAVEAALTLQWHYGFDAGDVDECEALVPPLVYRLVGLPLEGGVPSPQYAKLSIPFVVAIALIRGTVFITDFREEGLADPAVHELAGRIKVEQDTTITDENIMVPHGMRIRLKDGMEHECTLNQGLGHPDKPLSRKQHMEKFHACCAAGAGHLPESNLERLVKVVDGLEGAPSVEGIIRLLVP